MIFETALRDVQALNCLNLSRNVSKFMHGKLWVSWTSTGSQNLLPKQTRSLLFATTSWLHKVKNSKHQPIWAFKAYLAAFRTAQHILFCNARWLTACVQRNLKVILIKNHRKSLLFGYFKLGFPCLELNIFSRCFDLKDLTWKSVSNPWERTVIVYLTKCPKCMSFALPNINQTAAQLFLGKSNCTPRRNHGVTFVINSSE